jgi:hypothetical protein
VISPESTSKLQIGSVTPLYEFSSDSDDLPLGNGIRICRYNCKANLPEILSTHFSIHTPDFLLWFDPLKCNEVYRVELARALSDIVNSRTGDTYDDLKCFRLIELLTQWAAPYFMVLRLFKPGRLRAGETFILLSWESSDEWTALGCGRASMMTVDYGQLGLSTDSYDLRADEGPFVVAFTEAVLPLLSAIDKYPTLATALALYSEDRGGALDVVGSISALEALLTKREETEGLSYRLSLRVANLLGFDADSRKNTFKDVKKFYNLRSRIVHGTALDGKMMQGLDIGSIRETLRRVLLSVMALYSEGLRPDTLPDRLDELALDEEARTETCSAASKFLHMIASPPR